MNNEYESELKLWQEPYKKLSNNEEAKICLISIMNTINIVTNTIKYSTEIIKLAESILEKSTNNDVRINATQCLVDLYSQMDNIEMAKLEIMSTHKEDVVINCLNNVIKSVDYIINFKLHIIKSPFMSKIECINICGYSSVLGNLKNNIIKELTKDVFNQYNNLEVYNFILSNVNQLL